MKNILVIIIGIAIVFAGICFNGISNDDKETFTKYYNEFTESDIEDFELEFFEITNQKRIKNDVLPLVWDDKLHDIAKSHSQDMAKNNYFSHVNLDGLRSNDGAINEGYECEDEEINNIIYEGISENISEMGVTYQNYEPTHEECIIDGLMDSSEHKENMLKQTDSKIGIGIAINENHLYTTQNFC